MYESFYVRAVSAEEPVGVWIRNTVHKRPGHPPRGSVWCTVFDGRAGAAAGGPYMHKLTSAQLEVPPQGWISVGEHSRLGPGVAEGVCGEARWSLRFACPEQPLEHLHPSWLYRAPLPRTKLTSPAPGARFDGTLDLGEDARIELRGWPGMVGHNWGSEHAERWIWLHGTSFAGAPGAWLDVALGRILLAGRMTPWIANGVLSLDGRRHRLGGLRAARARVEERPDGCSVELSGTGGMRVQVRAAVPPRMAAGWRYADPDGGEHDVVNCSIASLQLDVQGDGQRRSLVSAHGGVYELGMRTPQGGTGERAHGVPIAPFADGDDPLQGSPEDGRSGDSAL
jgi:hypothetical protein